MAQKIKQKKFSVLISPPFEIKEKWFQVILDGHHRLVAADIAGVQPDLHIGTTDTWPTVDLLRTNQIADFLYAVYMDVPWFYWDTKKQVFSNRRFSLPFDATA